jgi:RHS repeat-associated protein
LPNILLNYRYGFNGMEKDDEVSGSGNSYDFGARLYDPRIGRWRSPDPIVQPWQSPYTSMDNNPVALTDRLGLKAEGKGGDPPGGNEGKGEGYWRDNSRGESEWVKTPGGDVANNVSGNQAGNQNAYTYIPQDITNAAQKGVDEASKFTGNTTTAACNIGCRTAFKEITGSSELHPSEGSLKEEGGMTGKGTANEIYDYLTSESVTDFMELTGDNKSYENMQSMANSGQIVLGVMKKEGHGHIVMIVPGELEKSGNYKALVPQILETGGGKRIN